MTIEDKISQFLSTTARLSKILKQENEILATQGRAKGIGVLADEKKALTNAYEQHMKILNSDDDLKTIDSDLRRRLEDAISSFSLLLEENAQRVRAKIEAATRLFDIVSEAAKSHQGQTAGYEKNGNSQSGVRQTYRPAVSLGLNHEL